MSSKKVSSRVNIGRSEHHHKLRGSIPMIPPGVSTIPAPTQLPMIPEVDIGQSDISGVSNQSSPEESDGASNPSEQSYIVNCHDTLNPLPMSEYIQPSLSVSRLTTSGGNSWALPMTPQVFNTIIAASVSENMPQNSVLPVGPSGRDFSISRLTTNGGQNQVRSTVEHNAVRLDHLGSRDLRTSRLTTSGDRNFDAHSDGHSGPPDDNVFAQSGHFDLNTFSRSVTQESPILTPLDKHVYDRIEAAKTTSEADKILKSFGMAAFKPAVHNADVAGFKFSLLRLVRLFLDVRSGRESMATFAQDVQIDVLTLCNIPLKASDREITAGQMTMFTVMWLPSFISVASQDNIAWERLTADGLRAHLGILGFPLTPKMPKAALLEAFPIARRLALHQGLTIPQVLDPFTAFTMPEASLLAQASPFFLMNLVLAISDPTSSPPPEDRVIPILTSFSGATIDGSVFEDIVWKTADHAIDRRLFLHSFGVPFALTTFLSAEELLPLLPRALPTATPFRMPVAVTPRRLARSKFMVTMQGLSSKPTGPMTPLFTDNGLGHSAIPIGVVSSIQTTFRTPSTLGLNSLIQTNTLQTPQSAASVSTIPFPGFGGIQQSPCVLPYADAIPSSTLPKGAKAETRTICFKNRAPSEYSLTTLCECNPELLRELMLQLYRAGAETATMTPLRMANYIWTASPVLGFRYLLHETAELCLRTPILGIVGQSWPNPTTQCITLLRMVGGTLEEALYTLSEQYNPFDPVPVIRTSGNVDIFPYDGFLTFGDTVWTRSLIPNRTMRSISGPTPLQLPSRESGIHPASALQPAVYDGVEQLTKSQGVVADVLGKANRKPSDGTRILLDALMDSSALYTLSSDHTLAGRQVFYNVLYRFVITDSCPIQCCLGTLVGLARSIADLDPNAFVPMKGEMDDHTACTNAKPFILFHAEANCPHTPSVLWSNNPVCLRSTLNCLFALWGALVLVDPGIATELLNVAERSYLIARDLPDWTVENNTIFWELTTDQVNDVFMAAGRKLTTVGSIIQALAKIPDYESTGHARERLADIRSTAYRMSWSRRASQTVVRAIQPLAMSVDHSTRPLPHPVRQPKPIVKAATPTVSFLRPLGPQQPHWGGGETVAQSLNDSRVSKSSCAQWNSTNGCRDGISCRYKHSVPTDPAIGERIYKLIVARSLTPSSAMSIFQPAATDAATPAAPAPHGQPARDAKSRFKRKRVTGGALPLPLEDILATIPCLQSSHAIRILGEPSAGDCAVALIYAFLTLVCTMYPSHFDQEKCPESLAEIRGMLAALMRRDLTTSADGSPTDDWHPLMMPDSSEVSGLMPLFPPHVIDQPPWESAVVHRNRCTAFVAYSESNINRRSCDPVFWLSTDLLERLLRFYIQHMFKHGPGKFIEYWLRKPPTSIAHVEVGPFCIACIDPTGHDRYLSRQTSELHAQHFQFIGIATGSHFLSYLNRRVIPITAALPVHGPDVLRAASIFQTLSDPFRYSHPEEIIAFAESKLAPRYPFELDYMADHFPVIMNFDKWDSHLHPYEVRHGGRWEHRFTRSARLLPESWRRGNDYFSVMVDDMFLPKTPLLLYGAFVSPSRRFARALYELDSFDAPKAKWAFRLVDRNDETFPMCVWLASGERICAIPSTLLPRATTHCLALYDDNLPPDVQAFCDGTEISMMQTPRRHTETAPAHRPKTPISLPRGTINLPNGWSLQEGISTMIGHFGMGLFLVKSDTTIPPLEPSMMITDVPIKRLLHVPDLSISTHVMLGDQTTPFLVSRDNFRDAIPFSIVYVPPDLVTTQLFCTWDWDEVSESMGLRLKAPVSSTAELFMDLGWFSQPPSLMSPASREAVCKRLMPLIRWEDKSTYEETPAFREHVYQLAVGFPHVLRELDRCWGNTSLLQVGEPFPTPKDITGNKRARLQRKYAAQRLKRTSRAAHTSTDGTPLDGPIPMLSEYGEHPILMDCWEALDLVAASLEQNGTLSNVEFNNKLLILAATFQCESDSSDTSPRVIAMRAENPPALQTIPDALIRDDEALYRKGGLEHLFEKRAQTLRFRGLPEKELIKWLAMRVCPEDDLYKRAIDLITHGQRTAMSTTFTPNGGFRGARPVANTSLYHSHRIVIEHDAYSLLKCHKAVILRYSSIKPVDRARLHIHTLFAVPKQGSLARVVTNMSYGNAASPSYNSSVDMSRHMSLYPRPVLPMLGDFATMFCKMRERFPNCAYLHGAVVDARTAFQLFHHTFEKFLLVWTKLQLLRGSDWVHVLVGKLCGTFGDTGAGDSWDVFAALLQHLHSIASSLWASMTYVDDMTIVAPPFTSDRPHTHRHYYSTANFGSFQSVPVHPPYDVSRRYVILDAIIEARENLACFFGQDSSEDRKTKLFCGCLESVGWYFDLRYTHWFVVPLPRKIEKIAHYLFNVIPANSTAVPLVDMQILAGLLCWYAVALPLGKSFVYPLFQCRRTHSQCVFIHSAAQRDLEFWRAIIRVALENPSVLGAPLELLRMDRVPDYYAVTDACTGVGGGAWLSRSPSWRIGEDNLWYILRWTQAERDAIDARLLVYDQPTEEEWSQIEPSFHHYTVSSKSSFHRPLPRVNINVLEFATVVFLIMVTAPMLRGCVISIGSDNTATLCWLVRNRSATGAADALLKLLSLTCVLYNIKLVVHHVKGIYNYQSDWLSRVLDATFADPHEIFYKIPMTNSHDFVAALAEQTGDVSAPLDRREICRLLLSNALVCQDQLSTQSIIRMLSILRHADTVEYITNHNITFVLDAFQRLHEVDRHPTHIPHRLGDAVDCATQWNTIDL